MAQYFDIILKKSNYLQYNNKICHYRSIIDFEMITLSIPLQKITEKLNLKKLVTNNNILNLPSCFARHVVETLTKR